ncbi:MAG TPA: nitrite/sulfite reductase [Burkholderiales bacterium]|nr:nitrite/sulfite reductase [Burkholderiales bacterium]
MTAQVQNLVDHAEIERYDEALQAYLRGEIEADRFTAIRLQQGIYGQRQEGVNMVRIKIPGGRLTATQLEAIAQALETYARHDVVHITTRQDIQMHYVPLESTPAVLRDLARAGLTTREACGNTIRNMTACPLAGLCPRQHVDVTRHLDGAVRHFLRNPLNQQLPRKFKISFSACEADCAQGLMHDLALVAVHEGGRFGFRVMAGGGLGHKPHHAIVIEPFIEEQDLIPVMEAVVALHNRYSDRTKRAKSRIKFLVDRFGPQGFIEKYREELVRTRAAHAGRADYPRAEWSAGGSGTVPGAGAPRQVFTQRQPGLAVVPIAVPIGNLNAAQLRGVAQVLTHFGLSEVRTTQDQNLMLPNVRVQDVAAIYAWLAPLGLGAPQPGDNVVACPGTSTCRLGITSSTIVAPKLDGGGADLRIRVSGCHNGCAQPETGDIGIYGEGKRLHGKLIPHYQTYFGGNGMGGGGLAIKGPSIPSARIETAIARVKQDYAQTREGGETFYAWVRRKGIEHLNALLADLTEVKPEQAAQLARDHGDEGDFRVLQLGGGECAGASQVKIGSAFFEAAHERAYRDAFRFQRKYAEALACAETMGRLVGQGLVQLLGGKAEPGLEALAQALDGLLPAEALGRELGRLAQALARPAEEWTEPALVELFHDLDRWTVEVARFAQSFDRQLDLTEALPSGYEVKPVHLHRKPQQPALAA